jgi:hypothetical protein
MSGTERVIAFLQLAVKGLMPKLPSFFCSFHQNIFILCYSYSSGGEDGYVRVHNFDQTYLDFRFEY